MASRKGDHVAEAAEALSDLNIFAAVVVLLESSLNHAPTHKAGARIIKIAKEEQQRCLRRYDRAKASAGGGHGG